MEDLNRLDGDISEAFQKKQMDKVCSLYYEAANYFETKSDIEAACFFYTQALVMALEEEFETEIPDEEAEKITTVKEAVNYIEAHT